MISIRFYISIIVCLFASMTLAQDISVPFFCGFEEDFELAHWTLNHATSDAHDQWCVGTATRSEGSNSLYISTDQGLSAQHAITNNIVIAYRTIKFPQKAGKYNISFDWKNQGNNDKAKLYVWVGPKDWLTSGFYRDADGNNRGLLDIVSAKSGVLPNQNTILSKFCKLSDGTNSYDYLAGSKKWQNVFITGDKAKPEVSLSISRTNAKKEFVLAFIWINNSIQVDGSLLGACIDNLQIASADLKRPSDLQATMRCEDSTVVITCKTTLPYHDIEYRRSGESWRKLSNIPANSSKLSYAFQIKQEGSYDFRVRGFNETRTDTSAYVSINNYIFWCFDNHCINYIDLSSPDVVCRYQDHSDTWPHIHSDSIGLIDQGEESMESRHTINWIADRYDPFTLGSVNSRGEPVEPLSTIPKDYLASVRLGNWDTGHGRESITYSFVVDSTNQSILIMKYAILFEDISNHENAETMFNLEVLDPNGRVIDPTCGVVNFEFKDASEWNVASDVSYGKRKINKLFWKDWTSIGLNLSPYHGMTIQVRITVTDCGLGAHAGWAYFVLDCVSAKIETDNCGESSTISVSAPAGFDYTWTNSKDSILGHEQSLTANTGYEVYTCEACISEMDGCCFKLSTVFDPRYPVPDYTYEWVPANCQNIIQFRNKSHVMNIHDTVEVHTSESCEHVMWEFTKDGFTSTSPLDDPQLICNPEGDTIILTLKAVIGGGKCDSVIQDTIYIPSILPRDSVIYANLCEGETYIFAKQAIKQSGTHQDVQPNFAGCDSISTLHLTVHPKSPHTFDADTVCSSRLPYTYNGYSYTSTGVYTQGLKNQWECDSMVTLSLLVLEQLEVQVDQLPTLCADDQQLIIDYSVMRGRYDSVAVRFFSSQPQLAFFDQIIYDTLQTTIVYPYDETILPDTYNVQLEFYQHKACENQVFDLQFDIQYSASIIEQKWNDVLALLNSKYNGGYTFTAYQWYKDGTPILGATGPYLYEGLDINAQYMVELTRPDGVVMRTCPFQPSLRNDRFTFPTLVTSGQRIPIHKAQAQNPITTINIFTPVGQLYSTYAITPNYSYVDAPTMLGNYVVHINYQDGTHHSQILIVTL